MVDFQEILDYGLRAQLAYVITQPGWYITEKLGLRSLNDIRLEIEDVPDAEVNTLVECHDNEQVQWISIRGSSNIKNWILDVQYIQHSVEEDNTFIQFHNGFYKATQDVYKIIRPHLDMHYKIRIAGHSLGGAIAAILMVVLHDQGYEVETCITFGQPRVTNKKGADYLAEHLKNISFLRVINQEDVVPLVPPSTIETLLQGGYEHFGPEVHLQPGTYTYSASHNDQKSRGESFWASIGRAIAEKDISDSTDNIKDHFMQHYLLNILSNMNTPDPKLNRLLSMPD